MSDEETPRDKLVAKLHALLAEAGEEKHERERLVHDLQVHQLELEMQNGELRDAQSALEASRSRYADLFDFAPIAYFTFDPHGRVLEVNLTGATLIGRDRAQVMGAPFPSLVELAEPPLFWAHLRRCAEARTPVVTELALTRRNGDSLYLRAVSSPVADPAGRAVAFRTAFVDVTDRHLAELARDASLASEQVMRRELEALDDAKTVLARSLAIVSQHSLSAILQIVVDQARTLVDADYAALGVGSALDAPFQAWVHSGMSAQQAAAIGRAPRAIGTLGAVVREARAIRADDVAASPAFLGFPPQHPAMTSFLGVPIWFGDRVVGNLYLTNKRGGAEFSADDQRSVESLTRYVGAAMEIARLGDEAQAAIRSRDNLLGVVSHDLRSPLSAITISARLLLRMLTSAEDTIGRSQAELIGRAALRMRRFVDDLLTATAIEAGHLTMTSRPERIDPIIREMVDELAPTAAEAELQLGAIVAAELPDVACDRERVQQVLSNLVGNAMKFAPPGGRITIEATRAGDEVQIAVIDAGPGIAEAALPHIFERYWKGVTDRQGVGLGLFICKAIAEGHGGRIWAESKAGEGARFTFTLPVAKPG